jgi:hypothetical protein
MKSFKNPKLNFKKVLVAKLNDAQMQSIVGGNIKNFDGGNKVTGQITDTITDTTQTHHDTTSLQSYFCGY